jgi:hypothetical protein
VNADPYIAIGALSFSVSYAGATGYFIWRNNRANRRRNRNRRSSYPQAGTTLAGSGFSVRSHSRSVRARANAKRTGARVSGRAGRELPVSTGTEPLIGYKTMEVRISYAGRPLGLVGAHVDVPYGNPDHAKCSLRRNHLAPHPQCSCGFYAMAEPITALGIQTIAEVEFYGLIIVASRGYRAQYQRVRRLIVPDECYICTRPSTHLRDAVAICKKHRDENSAALFGDVEAALDLEVIRYNDFWKEREGE